MGFEVQLTSKQTRTLKIQEEKKFTANFFNNVKPNLVFADYPAKFGTNTVCTKTVGSEQEKNTTAAKGDLHL